MSQVSGYTQALTDEELAVLHMKAIPVKTLLMAGPGFLFAVLN